jgi:NAD(P)-dependent dehydrogenase (short-subunit alcohol dehydrogenase family)
MGNVLMIGGSYGIGWEIAKTLSSKGENVIVASRTSTELNKLDVRYIPFDADNDTIPVNELPDNLSGFVYCPGTIKLRPYSNLKTEDFENDMRQNFFNVVGVLKDVLPMLKTNGNSSIVLFSSIAASIGMPYHTSISAAKSALEAYARSLSAELAPKVRVNLLAPSITDTPLASRILKNQKSVENIAAKHPMKRIGNAQDIAHAACFLLSDKSGWITGQTLHIDGGLSSIRL